MFRKAIASVIVMSGISLAVIGSAIASTITVDGNKGAGEYENSFQAKWVNGHASDFSIYDDFTDMTTVFYEAQGTDFYLFIAAPLYAKNMVWGTGADAYLEEYKPQYEHHKDFETKPLEMDFRTATGSEKVLFGAIMTTYDSHNDPHTSLENYRFDIDGSYDNAKSSLDYILSHPGIFNCDEINCAAGDTAMAFEIAFSLSAGDQLSLIAGIQEFGIEFHMSPERQGDPSVIPLPAALPLYGTGLAVIGLIGWRKRRKAAVAA